MTPALGALAARVVALAGIVALVAVSFFFGGAGAVFGTLNDIALLVMTLALVPVMATFYELGGRTPLRLAQASLASAVVAVLVWCATQVLLIGGAVTFAYDAAATGAFAVEAVAVAVIGLWLAGASLLAGSWLPPAIRWLGIAAGAGIAAFGTGLLAGGSFHPLTIIGGVGYQVLLPIWAALLARRLAARPRPGSGPRGRAPEPGP